MAARFLAVGVLALTMVGTSRAQFGKDPDAQSLRRTLSEVGRTCLAARKPADLEALSKELAGEWRGSAIDPTLGERRRAARDLVKRWRAYLEAKSKENNGEIVKILEELIQDDGWVALLPRSEVLGRYMEANRVRWVNYPIKTIDDLPAAIENLRNFDRRYGLWESGKATLTSLEELEQHRKTVAIEEPASVEAACRIDFDDSGDVIRFKQLLLPFVAAKYLNLPEEYHFAPAPGESAQPYLRRIFQRAQKRGDLVTLWRTRAYCNHRWAEEIPPWQTEEARALDGALTGRREEKAGKFSAAMVAYLAVLQSESGGASVVYATDRVRKIRGSQPEAYASALAYQTKREMERRRESVMGWMPGQQPTPPPELEEPWRKY